MSRNTYSGPNAGVGMASVIMIALVLALTTFGILSLVSARADAAMSRKARENAEAYYEAEERLAKRLADLDAGLLSGAQTLPQEGSFVLAEEVKEGQELVMELAAPALGQKGRFAVLGFKLVNTSEWTPDESLEIWDGGL